MRILITTFTFPPETNGVSQVCYKQAMMLHKYGHDVAIATGICNNRNFDDYKIKIHEFNVTGNANIRSRYKGEIKKYIDFIANYECDIIYCQAWQIWSTDLAIKAFRNNPAKKVLISHGISANSTVGFPRTIMHWLLWRPYIWAIPKLMDSFDHIIFLSSKQDKNRFYDFYLMKKMRKENFSIIPNGVDLFDNEPNNQVNFKQMYNIQKNSFMILSVSNYAPMKDQMFVLKSFLKSEIDNASLVFIGTQKNEYSNKLEEYYKSHKSYNKNKVYFFDNVPRKFVIDAYKNADLFCFGSKSEYFPLVIIEAMMSKTTWISTNVGCVSALPGGFVVKNIFEMSQHINTLSIDVVENERQSQIGYEFAINNLQWSIVGNKLNELFQKIINE